MNEIWKQDKRYHDGCQYIINPIEVDSLRKCYKPVRVVMPKGIAHMDRHFCLRHAYIIIRGILKAEHDRA